MNQTIAAGLAGLGAVVAVVLPASAAGLLTTVQDVPEPSLLGLFAGGAVVLVIANRYRKRK